MLSAVHHRRQPNIKSMRNVCKEIAHSSFDESAVSMPESLSRRKTGADVSLSDWLMLDGDKVGIRELVDAAIYSVFSVCTFVFKWDPTSDCRRAIDPFSCSWRVCCCRCKWRMSAAISELAI